MEPERLLPVVAEQTNVGPAGLEHRAMILKDKHKIRSYYNSGRFMSYD